MSGRFLAAPLLPAVALSARSRAWSWPAPAWVLAGLAALSLISPDNPWRSRADYHVYPGLADDQYYGNPNILPHEIADERGFYYHATGLLRATPRDFPKHMWIDAGRELRRRGFSVTVNNCIGFLGYYAGPHAQIVDGMALADALLARLPTVDGPWRIGHFERKIPDGYLASVHEGVNRLQHPGLAAYFEKLARITRGDLWDLERFKDILYMNLGLYRKWIPWEECRRGSPQSRVLVPVFGCDEYARLVSSGMLAAAQDRWQDAEKLWRQAAAKYPDRPEVHANLGLCLEHNRQPGQALAEYALAEKGLHGPWRRDLQAVQENIRRPLPAAAAGRVQERMLAQAEGEDDYAQLVRRGLQALERKEWPAAVQFWLQAAKLDPGRPEARANLGICYEHARQWEEALAEYQAAARALGKPWDQYAEEVRKRLQNDTR